MRVTCLLSDNNDEKEGKKKIKIRDRKLDMVCPAGIPSNNPQADLPPTQ